MISFTEISPINLGILLFALFWLICYLFIVIRFSIGWKNICKLSDKKNIYNSSEKLFITVVIAVRNEAGVIGKLLKNLAEQSYPKEFFEIIICDDNSEDSTTEEVNNFIIAHPDINTSLLSAIGEGKKNALAQGINQANGSWIITTDADCKLSENWIKSFSKIIENKSPKMIVGAVSVIAEKSFFSKLQALEFGSLIASGGGAIEIGKPFMCNGANLAFEKSAWEKVNVENSNSIISGDDVFLLHSIKRFFGAGSIVFNPNRDGLVKTTPQRDLLSFLNQRIRWAAKSSFYKDWFSKFTALTVFLASLFTLVLLVIPKLFLFGVLFFLIKLVIDFPILRRYTVFIENKKLLNIYFFLQPIYIIYIIFAAFFSFFGGYKWKGRKHKR